MPTTSALGVVDKLRVKLHAEETAMHVRVAIIEFWK